MKKLFFLTILNIDSHEGDAVRAFELIKLLKSKNNIEIMITVSFVRYLKILTNKHYKNIYYKKLNTKKIIFLPVLSMALKKFNRLFIELYLPFLNVNNSTIMAENIYAGYYALPFKKNNNRIVVDIDGLNSAEYEYKHNFNKQHSHGKAKGNILKYARRKIIEIYIYPTIKHIEQVIIKDSDGIICVSEQFKSYIVKKLGYKNKILVIPMLIDNSLFQYDENARNEIRNKLKLNDKLVITYCGSMVKWQKPVEIIKIFKKFKEALGRSYLLLIVHKKYHMFAKQILSKNNINPNDYKLISTSHKSIPEYLSASDIGLLLRDNVLMNNVASPTKLLEYLSVGVFPVASKNIGDTDKIIKQNEYGYSINNNNNVNINNIINVYHKRANKRTSISIMIKNEYSWNNYYNKLNNMLFPLENIYYF